MDIKVLVVEDEQYMLDIIGAKLKLEKIGHHTASTYDEAVALLESHDWSLVVTDIMFPFKSGVELAEYIVNKKYSIPVLFISAKNHSDFLKEYNAILEKYPSINNFPYLTKPFDLDDFIKKIRELLPAESKEVDQS